MVITFLCFTYHGLFLTICRSAGSPALLSITSMTGHGLPIAIPLSHMPYILGIHRRRAADDDRYKMSTEAFYFIFRICSLCVASRLL